MQSMTYPCVGSPAARPLANRAWLSSWLDKLGGVLGRSRPGRPDGDERAPAAEGDDPRLDGRLRQAQKMELAGRMATGLVHDFNNAVLVALACLDNIAEAPGDRALVRNHSLHATEALHRASEMARRLATFGRPDDGSRRLIDLNELVRASVTLASPIAGRGITVDIRCHPQPLRVHVDPGQIEQALINLCFNARDAMAEGGTLRITTRWAVRCRPSDGAGATPAPAIYAMVEVSDTGCGIPPELQSLVFEPFFTTKAPGQSSGLGLSMVGETARVHGGLVEFTTNPAGTAFRLLFPPANR